MHAVTTCDGRNGNAMQPTVDGAARLFNVLSVSLGTARAPAHVGAGEQCKE